MTDNIKLLEMAKDASYNAYAPYSNFSVGACAYYDSGNTYVGCNVENTSYGLSLCAERNAIANAVATGEKGKLLKLAIYSKNTKRCMPCGACRQWIAEFKKDGGTEIIFETEDAQCASFTIDELLPHAFNLD